MAPCAPCVAAPARLSYSSTLGSLQAGKRPFDRWGRRTGDGGRSDTPSLRWTDPKSRSSTVRCVPSAVQCAYTIARRPGIGSAGLDRTERLARPFDGYPYLVSRIGQWALCHIAVVPADWQRARLLHLVRRQAEINRLETFLCLEPSESFRAGLDGALQAVDFIPTALCHSSSPPKHLDGDTLPPPNWC